MLLIMSEKIKIRKTISKHCQEIEKKHYLDLSKLGMFIRKNRKLHKISSAEFSKHLGFTRSKLQNLEEGFPNIPLYDYLKALDALGLKMDMQLNVVSVPVISHINDDI